MSGEEGGVNSSTGGPGSGSGSRCQDCGNQAKRDCEHLRCRTCCKSRSFQCQTHVKSTWVPDARRRPKLLHQNHQIIPQPPPPHLHHHHHHHGPNPKRIRDHAQAPLGLEEGEDLPGEVSFPAVFRCVRVSSMDNVVDQYAYQTSVSIGGHVFTGILYDQGPEPDNVGSGQFVAGGNTGAGIGLLQNQPSFGAGTTSAATGATSTSFPSPFCAFSATTSHFFHYPNS